MQNLNFLLIATLCVFQSFGDALVLKSDPPGPNIELVHLGEKGYYFETANKVNWLTALNYCRQIGMNLVDITSKEENDKIKGHISSLGIQNGRWWTSGNDLENEGTFSWKSTGELVSFTDWLSGEPNNLYQDEHCLELWFRNGVMKWNDLHCYWKSNFICEKKREPEAV